MKPGRGARRTGGDGWGAAEVGGTKAETVPHGAAPPIPRHPPRSSAPPSCSAGHRPRPPGPTRQPCHSQPLLTAHPARVPAAAAATPLPPPPPPPPSQPRQPPQPPRFSLSRRRRKAPQLLPRGYTRQNGETETSWQI
ncbi:basic proline-rich protein-like [Pan troglodytes]|uniref:basic proline-rich protein-like n=1 Tax=Pan troglodytes TaxID=9598 RepID=UPI00301403A6